MEPFTATEDILQLVTFTLGTEEYAVDILKVQEINRMTSITMVPNAPPFVEGVINLRGKVIPVVNLRKKFGIPGMEDSENAKIMIVDLKGVTMGLIVDAVSEVLRVPANIVEPTPPMATDISTEFIYGIAKLNDRLIIMLDLDKMIDSATDSFSF
ncbi:MAG: chemotaxis protein CheW [Nitrospirae bacterium]|nr:chemotaxis protein CheW [Nitrospirota bacterium]MBF0535054.1 chemotaxis protein CheW [Nitrospirota bacterium]MBF0616562.1 chemotaxis protein CheW [Nitrospirota bacterium]